LLPLVVVAAVVAVEDIAPAALHLDLQVSQVQPAQVKAVRIIPVMAVVVAQVAVE
jgi:hypothetical protein